MKNYTVIECSLCNMAIGFNFSNEPAPVQYCYQCGHSMLLIVDQFASIDFNKIKDYTKEDYKKANELETATIYWLNKLNKPK